MSKELMRKLLPLLAAVALLGVFFAVRRERLATHSAAGSTVRPFSAPSAGSNPPVIRFVKDPEAAPAVQARDLTGKPVSTADWRGKVVLVNFWATWCPPCREEIPEMINLQNQYPDRLQIIGISEDDDSPDRVLKFAQQQGINYPIVMYTPELTAAFGGVPALPTTFLIDTEGRVVQKHTGLYAIESYTLEIRALLEMPVEARVENFVDTGQVFLKNAANATELPGVDLTRLTAEQKKAALHRLNADSCTCGCALTLSQCRVNDTECPVSGKLAAQVVQEVARGGKLHRAAVLATGKPPERE